MGFASGALRTALLRIRRLSWQGLLARRYIAIPEWIAEGRGQLHGWGTTRSSRSCLSAPLPLRLQHSGEVRWCMRRRASPSAHGDAILRFQKLRHDVVDCERALTGRRDHAHSALGQRCFVQIQPGKMVKPPSTRITCPLMKRARGPARKATASAISSGSA